MHKTVLLKEAIDGLNLKAGNIFLDGTLGGGGHSKKVCEDFPSVRIVATDRDADAIERVKGKFADCKCKYDFVKSNFKDMDKVILSLGIEKVDAILLDLGLSSDQLDASGRGFTFKNDEPLLMTFSNEVDGDQITAKDILNFWKEETIADILYAYADERYSRKIAKAIVKARDEKPIEKTSELVSIIESAVPSSYRKMKIHCATKTFQALRIAVNDELGSLKQALNSGFEILNHSGRFAVISFHSLEDREVKNFFRNKSKDGSGILITKKPIVPTEDEIRENPRSRSAKLRIIEKK